MLQSEEHCKALHQTIPMQRPLDQNSLFEHTTYVYTNTHADDS